MLPIKSKYKIAKRLGAGIFEQTQTQKFALAEANSKPKKRARGGGSDYGRQLLEKQKVRYTYGLAEKQLSSYAEKAFKAKNPSEALHRALELRADSAIYRAGIAPTRRAARQAVSHGHITINGRRITSPSYSLKKGDKLSVREGNKKSPLYASLAEKEGRGSIPQWLTVDLGSLSAEIIAEPQFSPLESGLDYPTVFEFYSR